MAEPFVDVQQILALIACEQIGQTILAQHEKQYATAEEQDFPAVRTVSHYHYEDRNQCRHTCIIQQGTQENGYHHPYAEALLLAGKQRKDLLNHAGCCTGAYSGRTSRRLPGPVLL